MGLMIESNLVARCQTLVNGKALTYGQSITDACINWSETHTLLRGLIALRRGVMGRGTRGA
jgi:3-deoxy-7-phosphoheptulonate synthase